MLDGLTGVNSLAVDSNRGYLFVASRKDSASSVDRYQFAVDITKAAPILSVNQTSKANVYRGGDVQSIAVDAD